MNKVLILAEKPSVALDISRALGKFTRKDNYFENEYYVLASSIGHLLGLVAPNDPARGKWSFANLPVIPDSFELKLLSKKYLERLHLLIKLIKRKDVISLINACDAGREGELIFRYIIQYSGVQKPIKRLWLQSMTQKSIISAFSNLRDDIHLKPLEAAARSRAEADWLIGINGTRAMTAFNSKEGGFFKTPVGRVQTPTLTIVFNREKSIKEFEPRSYCEIHAEFFTHRGTYKGRWFDQNFKKNTLNLEDREYRLWSRKKAEDIVLSCQNKSISIYEEFKTSFQFPPTLYDLTTLQRDANNQFGFSAKTTLNIAQNLYEKHKALTYPRTDSRFLPEDYFLPVIETIQSFSKIINYEVYSLSLINNAKKILENDFINVKNQRIFNNLKISDHFAIIPTSQIPLELNDLEKKIYNLVLRRFIAVFFPPAKYQLTLRFSEIENQIFKTDGKILEIPGWLEIYNSDKPQKNEENLCKISKNEKIYLKSMDIKDLFTKPPIRYNEAALLSAMERAGKFIEHDEIRAAMKECGLGTPATRSSIIEGLINENYLRRDGRDLVPTAKTRQLMNLLSGLNIKELTSPELTGEWEFKLKKIELGILNRVNFMQEIAEMAKIIVKRTKEYSLDTIPGDYIVLKTPCPKCKSVVKENYHRYACTQCDFSIGKHPGKRTFELEEVEQLLNSLELGPVKGFVSKAGRPFSAMLRINSQHKLEFDFGKHDEIDELINYSNADPVGKCPKCSSSVFEYKTNYMCEKSIDFEKHCNFRISKIILQQEISRDQIEKLLRNGRTDLIDGFISKRTNKKFKVCLIFQKNGSIGFEFENSKKTRN
ncbi:MAG: DNA topoisomerase III [Bordetella sp.]|nr:MAG: DNA topoisomerase III [Bordetella sp.]